MRARALPVTMILFVALIVTISPGLCATTTQKWIPTIQRTTLDNNLTILTGDIQDNGIITVGIMIRAGSADDPAGKAGLANIVANAVLTGSNTMEPDKFAAQLARICGDTQLEVTRDATLFLFRLPSERINELLALIQPALKSPRLDSKTLEMIRTRTVAMLRERSTDVRYVLNRNVYDFAFANHPYATAVLGTEASLNNITTKDLTTFHRNYYGSNNTTIAVIGDLNGIDAVAVTKKYFTRWAKAGLGATTVSTPQPNQQLRVRLVNRTGANITHICMVRPLKGVGTENFVAALALADILGGGQYARLSRDVASEIKGCYHIAAAVQPGAVSAFRIGAMCHGKETQAVIDRVTDVMTRVATEGVTEEELTLAKAHLLNKMMLTMTSGTALTRTILTWQACGIDPTRPEAMVQQINNLNPTTLASAAKDLLNRDRFALLVIGDRNTVAEDLRRLADVEVVEFAGEIPVPAMRTILKKITK